MSYQFDETIILSGSSNKGRLMKNLQKYLFTMSDLWLNFSQKLFSFVMFLAKIRFAFVFMFASILNLYLKLWDNTFQIMIDSFKNRNQFK